MTTTKLTESDLILAVYRHRHSLAPPSIFIPNTKFHDWNVESDLIEINKRGFVSEYEIKISRSDLYREYGKRRWRKNYKFHRYWFVIPHAILFDKRGNVHVDKILDYVRKEHGIMVVDEYGGVKCSRTANGAMTHLRNARHNDQVEQFDLLGYDVIRCYKRLGYKYWNLREQQSL